MADADDIRPLLRLIDCFERGNNSFPNLLREVSAHARKHDDKLVPAEADQKVAGTDVVLNDSGNRNQQLIARLVAKNVVDFLEPVDVQKTNADDAIVLR